MLKISWLPTASDDLAEIIAYIAEHSPQAARNLRKRIEAAVRPVAEHPYLYKRGRTRDTREIVAHPNYIIVYRVTDTAIEVVSVKHRRHCEPKAKQSTRRTGLPRRYAPRNDGCFIVRGGGKPP